jgi:hypothetical protein
MVSPSLVPFRKNGGVLDVNSVGGTLGGIYFVGTQALILASHLAFFFFGRRSICTTYRKRDI